MAANRAEIPGVTSVELSEIDLDRCGLKGSPTRVKSTFVPVHENHLTMIKEDTIQESSRKLIELLDNAHVI